MIPPLAPGQNEDNDNMVKWKNTFDLRQVTLLNLAASNLSLRTNGRNQITFNRMRNGCVSNSTKSLDILRRNLQSAINRDIDAVIKKYLEKFFQPAIENIRSNLGRESVNDEHIKDVCRQILEEAKQSYIYSSESRDSSPYECSDSETGSQSLPHTSPLSRKRKESDTDSENSLQSSILKRTKFQNIVGVNHRNNLSPNRQLKFEGPKWNPERIVNNTLFIMGARANKVLGYKQTRGRLYVRHPDLMRYSGDQEDRDWLSRHNLLPANGGKAYLLVLDDIKELTCLDEYKNSPNLLLSELKGFEVPLFMLNKIRTFMEKVRSDGAAKIIDSVPSFDLYDFQTSITPPTTVVGNVLDSESPSTDNLQAQLDSNVRANDLNLYINAPEISPGSNSFLTQSPINNNLLSSSSQNITFSTNDLRQNNNRLSLQQQSTLSAFLSGQISSDNSQDDSEF